MGSCERRPGAILRQNRGKSRMQVKKGSCVIPKSEAGEPSWHRLWVGIRSERADVRLLSSDC
jgi:hypothetical protein